MKNAQILVDACKNAGVPLTDDQIMVITGALAVLEIGTIRSSGINIPKDHFRLAYQEWVEKTDWLRKTLQPKDLGKHLADVMREHIEAADDHQRLVRELDVLINGEEGAAPQASLCDIVSQVRREGLTRPQTKKPDDFPNPGAALSNNERLTLSQAGFTARQISEHRQKFYNLFNIAPFILPYVFQKGNEPAAYLGSDRTPLPLNTRRKDIAPLFLLPVRYQEPLTHVGNSKFESWYEQYHIRLGKQGPKQIARDAYAAGMGEQARYMKGDE